MEALWGHSALFVRSSLLLWPRSFLLLDFYIRGKDTLTVPMRFVSVRTCNKANMMPRQLLAFHHLSPLLGGDAALFDCLHLCQSILMLSPSN